jgi:hypothetical protein
MNTHLAGSLPIDADGSAGASPSITASGRRAPGMVAMRRATPFAIA